MKTETKPSIDTNDGNVFVLVGKARGAMKRAGVSREDIDAMCQRVMATQSYDEALRVLGEYVAFEF